ncbi:MAG TPA: type IV pilin-like G/H family protein [Coleofasciculaceae cyanobacterium]
MPDSVSNLCARSCQDLIARLNQARLLFPVSCQLISKGLLLALLSIVGTPIIARPLSALTVTQAQDTSKKNTVAEQLLGRWQAKDPTTDEIFTFIFAPEGNLFMVLPAPDGSSIALKVAYEINPTAKPMQLDIKLSPEQKALTIFELTADGQLRLELEGLTPSVTRPTEFRPNATLFKRTSELTTVPENIKVIEFQAFNGANQKAPKPENEAKNYMYALTKVQQAHYLEQGKFATQIEQVSIGLKTETESYRYQFLPQGDETHSVMITAIAKTPQLPSYTGAVFATKVNGKTTTAAQICETEKPSMSPPAMPVAPNDSLKIQCPVGSRALELS